MPGAKNETAAEATLRASTWLCAVYAPARGDVSALARGRID